MATETQASGLDRSAIYATRLKPAALVVTGVALLAAGWYAAQVVVLDHSASAALTASVTRASKPLGLDDAVEIRLRGAGVQLGDAQLFRATIGVDGSRSAEAPVSVHLESVTDDGTWRLAAAGGGRALQPDGAYRLAVTMTAPRPAMPLPRISTIVQEFPFTTVASPHPSVPAAPLQPRWAEPVSITWSESMQSIAATAEPSVPVTTWVDNTDPRKTWLQLGDGSTALADGQTYTVRVTDAHGRSGIGLQTPAELRISVPQRPRFIDVPTDTVTLRAGDNLTLHSSLPLAAVEAWTSEPDLAVATALREGIRVDMPGFQQGASFDVLVTAGSSDQGAPLMEPVQFHVVTPPALDTPTVIPDDGSIGVQPLAHPRIRFPEAIADPSAATNALSIVPPVAGQWQWNSASEVEFVPTTRLPITTDMTLTVRGGPAGPRTATGAYLDTDVTSTFRTTDFKRMDVSLSRQTMTLYEYDRPVRTIFVATGVAAAPTPTGTYYVQYKSPQMRFRGVNPDGSRYDIPDVHWVMPFWGDYTIHGAYWRGRFGTPGSDGCVSMTDADAKTLYDWADVGTPIVIHS